MRRISGSVMAMMLNEKLAILSPKYGFNIKDIWNRKMYGLS